MSASAMIFTLNEEIHLPSCLASLSWCDDIIIVDSYSADRTKAICEEAGTRFFEHEFTGFGDQRNWALDHCEPRHEWVLILDADERVPPELAIEIDEITSEASSETGAFRIRRRFHMWGQWLRYSSLYPTWVVRLVHRDRVRYVNRGHAETQQVEGEIRDCTHDLIDENLKGIDEWFERQNQYSTKDAAYELAHGVGVGNNLRGLFSADPLVRRAALKQIAWRLPARSWIYFIYAYVFRRGFLDGSAGFHFCRLKAMYQSMIEVKKHDIRRRE